MDEEQEGLVLSRNDIITKDDYHNFTKEIRKNSSFDNVALCLNYDYSLKEVQGGRTIFVRNSRLITFGEGLESTIICKIAKKFKVEIDRYDRPDGPDNSWILRGIHFALTCTLQNASSSIMRVSQATSTWFNWRKNTVDLIMSQLEKT